MSNLNKQKLAAYLKNRVEHCDGVIQGLVTVAGTSEGIARFTGMMRAYQEVLNRLEKGEFDA